MKHILFLTWKDLKHPRAGGAERVMYEYAQRLVHDGHRVTWFASSFTNAADYEQIEGIDIYRKYSLNTIYFLAYFWYKKFTRENPIDIIIDEAGGIPLLSPLYAKKVPIYFFIHHIGKEEYEKAFFFPLNKAFTAFVFWTFGLYKNLPTLTVSNSTAQELREKYHFQNVSIIENATHLTPISKINWAKKKREIAFYGRLTRMKRADHAIRAFAILAKKDPDYHMNIIGNPQDTEYVEDLHILVNALGLKEKVHFLGYSREIVSEYLPRSEVLLVPSSKEGYGLVVLEGNCFGLPVLAYDVPGIRDSIRDGINGFLIADENYKEMGNILIDLIFHKEKLYTISGNALNYVKNLGGWDERYGEFKKVINI